MGKQPKNQPAAAVEDRKLIATVKQRKARYAAITPQFEEFPYSGDVTITFEMWKAAMTATEYLYDQEGTIRLLDEMTKGGFSRLIGIFGEDYLGNRTSRDFTRIMNALRRGAESDLGEKVDLDRFGCPNIAPYMAGCRPEVSVPVDEIEDVDLDTFVAPWHTSWPEGHYFYETAKPERLYEDEDGSKWAVAPYNRLWSWDQYKVLCNLYAEGYAQTLRNSLGGKTEAREAAQLEDKAAVILYDNMDGVMVGYSKACDEVDKKFMAEIGKDNPEYKLTYTPRPGKWEPTMELTLPRAEISAWRAAGGTPQQLKRLRGTIYTMLLNEERPYWWKRYQVTLTFGQIVRAIWNDDRHMPTENEKNLIEKSLSLLVNTRIVCKYPDLDKKHRHQHIDVNQLTIEGMALLPAVFAHGTDARGHVVENSSIKFYALPPLDAQADELNQAYTLPYPNGTSRVKALKGRVEATTLDVQTELGKYIRIAKAEGSQTVYIDKLTEAVEPFKYAEITELTEWANDAMASGDPEKVMEAKADKRRQQDRMRNLRRKVKRETLRVLPQLIENEATSDKPHYLSVDTAPGRRDGFIITRVKPTDRQRKEHRKPRTHFNYGKK